MVPCRCQASSCTGQHQSHLPLLPPQAFSYDGRNQPGGGGGGGGGGKGEREREGGGVERDRTYV